MTTPQTRYAKSGDVHIAHQVIGEGPRDLVLVPGWVSHLECACAIRSGASRLGIEVRAGLHTGECAIIGDKVGGIAVHIGARIAGAAKANEVLVSATVKDLVAGSGIVFEPRGAHALKGVPGEWPLYAVSSGGSP
jgi:class 3 adenylate cyclase